MMGRIGPPFRLAWLSAVCLVVAGCVGIATQAAGTEEHVPPNVVIILADDAGYADFGFMGSHQIETPNLDRLASEGAIYDAAYATTPFCSPSRAGLLTGRYPQRFGYEFNLTHAPPPGVDPRFMGIAVEEETLGSLMKQGGYATIAIGKWHLGEQPQFHPNARGFDHFYGFVGGGSSYFPDRIGAGVIERNGDPVAAMQYLTDDFAREAAEQIEANRHKPFLLYLAFNAVHTPMDARPEDLARFEHIEDKQRRRLAAMTWAMDRAVGKVLDTLQEQGIAKKTLVIFTNDNGGDRIGLDADNGTLRGTKGTLLEGGIRVPMVVRFPDGRLAGQRVQQPVSLMDLVPTALTVAGVELSGNVDGVSLAQLPEERRRLFWRYDNMAAMRDGNWKVLRYPDRPAELYDLGRDIGETRNLAAIQPERVSAMMKALFEWEGELIHPRWNTGSFWSQEDVRRYSEDHIRLGIAQSKATIETEQAQ